MDQDPPSVEPHPEACPGWGLGGSADTSTTWRQKEGRPVRLLDPQTDKLKPPAKELRSTGIHRLPLAHIHLIHTYDVVLCIML